MIDLLRGPRKRPVVLGHRGTGPTRAGHPFPENSLQSFREAVAKGADGVELDLLITGEGELLVMHDDTLDRTTTCSGFVRKQGGDELRKCCLVDGEGRPAGTFPPCLGEVYAALPDDTLVNVELKVCGEQCPPGSPGPRELACAAVREIKRLGVTHRTGFSSFDAQAATEVKTLAPEIYSGLLLDFEPSLDWRASLDRVLALGLDGMHPQYLMPWEGIRAALDAGLYVFQWTVNQPDFMRAGIELGVTGMITDDPGRLAGILKGRLPGASS